MPQHCWRIQKIMIHWLLYAEKVLKSFSHWGALVLYFLAKQLCWCVWSKWTKTIYWSFTANFKKEGTGSFVSGAIRKSTDWAFRICGSNGGTDDQNYSYRSSKSGQVGKSVLQTKKGIFTTALLTSHCENTESESCPRRTRMMGSTEKLSYWVGIFISQSHISKVSTRS